MRFSFSRLDALLLGMTLIWGSNFSLIKAALRQMPELGFNGLRMALALTAVCGGHPACATASARSPLVSSGVTGSA